MPRKTHGPKLRTRINSNVTPKIKVSKIKGLNQLRLRKKIRQLYFREGHLPHEQILELRKRRGTNRRQKGLVEVHKKGQKNGSGHKK